MIQDIGKQVGRGMDSINEGDMMKGMTQLATAPLAKFGKGEDKKDDKQAAPVIINIIPQAKGDEDKNAAASASAGIGGASSSASV